MNFFVFNIFIVAAIYLKSFPSFRKYSWLLKSHRYYPLIYRDAPCILFATRSSADSGGGRRKRATKPNEKGRPRGDPSWLPVSLNWRLYNIEVLLENDPGKDTTTLHTALVSAVATNLNTNVELLSSVNMTVVRKSFDGRWKKAGQPKFVYTVDVSLTKEQCRLIKIVPKEGRQEPLSSASFSESGAVQSPDGAKHNIRVVIIGAGPAGLFAALSLVDAGVRPVVVERGKPVEQRGRSIGALFNRGLLDPESNLCYGEGGAGTWSDGKLTTRIGKNSDDVRRVLERLVTHGAPDRILVDGKPHLGTDRLVRILKSVRDYLESKGTTFLFDNIVQDLVVEKDATAGEAGGRKVTGIILSDGRILQADAVVLAAGHSARLLYEKLLHHGVDMQPKPIAVGFRVEHPQELINRIQYGAFGDLCERGKGKVPVADYRLASQVEVNLKERSCYSFCMCPGGQIVPTSVRPDELCVNGMSFSMRQSQWANSALVVGVTPEDMEELCGSDPLRGVEWQRIMERRAAAMGGGGLVAPVQRVTDFLNGVDGSKSQTANDVDDGLGPVRSSYRLGVKEGPLHELYPSFVTEALRKALLEFDKQMPGFVCKEAILHGVETRTSAPVQVTRHADSFESISLGGLFPAGEGAGYAGGIVSAAVDGMKVAGRLIDRWDTTS